ncbi:MAG: exo-alpha-sialidase [Candidatus Hydrogenedentes bacterium]|nr:exo-alpha-sialidase [Candidatus Hydrogenedentota bacterium]
MRPFTCVAISVSCALCAGPLWAVDFQGAERIDGVLPDTFFERNVRVATDRAGNWVAVYERLNQSGSFQYDIAAIRSDDDGDTWSDPTFVNSNSGDTRDDTVPQIATDGDGKWVCVWKGDHNTMGNYGIFTAISTDNGATWSDRVELDYTSFDPFNPYVDYPHVASDGTGNWIIVWQTHQPSNPPTMGVDQPLSIAYSVSTDGANWSTKQKLNSTGPSNHTAYVASDREGTWICAWVSTGADGQDPPDIVYSRSTDDGDTWSPQTLVNDQLIMETGVRDTPRLAADGNGNWVIVWDGYYADGQRYDVYSAYSDDDGMTWSNRKLLSTIPPKSDDDVNANIATDRNGRWVVVWQRAGSANYELYKSESSDNGATWTTPTDAGLVADNNNSLHDWGPSIATDEDGHWAVLWHTEGNAQLDLWRSISGPPYPGTLTLTTPNGGEKWKLGKKGTIEWKSTGNTGGKVRLELFRFSSFVTTMKASTDNDGLFRWRVPENYSEGDGYIVRIYSKNNFNIRDRSDKEFRLKSPD